jgi:hypothetical protein
MFAILPLVGGILLGWFAPRTIAIVVQAVLICVAGAVLIATAPDHDATHAQGALLALAVAVVSIGTLALGFWIRSRRSPVAS